MDAATVSAIASAIAAIASAVTAILLWRVERSNQDQEVHPELVLTNWGRNPASDDGSAESISIGAIRNVGRGVALNLHLFGSLIIDNKPVAALSNLSLQLVAPGDKEQIDSSITVFWKNAPSSGDVQYVQFALTLLCFDAKNHRHETTYGLLILRHGQIQGSVTRGVSITSRKSTHSAIWRFRLKTALIEQSCRFLLDEN